MTKTLIVFKWLTVSLIFVINSRQAIALQSKTDSLLTVLKTAKEDTAKVKTLNALAYELRNNDPDTAIYFAREAIMLAIKNNYKMGVAKGYANIGIAKKNHGDMEEALKFHREAQELFYEIGDKRGIASSFLNIGNIYFFQGNYPEAQKNFFASLKLREELKDKQGIVSSIISIANVYKNQQSYTEAMNYYKWALKASIEIGDKAGISSAYGGLGVISIANGSYSEALKYQLLSLRIAKELGNKKDIAIVYNNIGINYYNQRNYPEALKNYFLSLKIKEEINDIDGRSSTLGNIGNIYIKQRKFQEAKTYLNRALENSKITGNLPEIRNAYGHFQELDSIQGDFKQAFEDIKLFVTYRDSIINEENTKKLVKTQMQYEFDKKEAATRFAQEKKDAVALAEIGKQKVIRNAMAGGTGVLLFSSAFSFLFYKRRRDAIEKQKEAEFGLQVSDVEMKALRSQMNPHFIFNSMNSIHRFIQQQNVKEASEYIIKFSRLMRLVLENSEHQEVELTKDMEALNLYMQLESLRMDKHFDFEIKIDESIDQENTMVPPLLLQPFIENSIWHGLMLKETTGKITINISKENEMIKCIVEDNGVGRERAQQANLNKEKKSLGMKITKSRIDIINKIKKSDAFIQLTDLYDQLKNPSGTRVEIQFPVSYQY